MSVSLKPLIRQLGRSAESPIRLEGLHWHSGEGDGPRTGPIGLAGGRFAAADPEAESFDLRGWTLLPGLCDAHFHLFHEARRQLRIDLSGIARRQEFLDRLALAPAEGPVLAVGWDESAWDDPRFPQGAELDRLFPDRPALLIRVCGHVAVTNRSALATLESGDQPVQHEAGVLVEDAVKALSDCFPIDAVQLLAAVGEVAGSLAAAGLTAVTEMGSRRLPQLVAALSEDLPLRVEYFHSGPLEELPGDSAADDSRHLPLGRKFFLDGSIGGRTAAVAPAYRDDGEGRLLWETKRLREALAECFAAGRRAALHAIGERALEQALDCLEDLAPPPGSARLEHVEMGRPEQVRRAARLGLGICIQPNFMARWGGSGGLYEGALGPAYRRRFLGPGDFRAAGIDLAYGTDGMPARLWPALAAAVDESVFAAQADTPPLALAAVTGSAALLAGQASRRGLVKEGLAADFCLVEPDPAAEVYRTTPLSELTVLAGRPTWIHPKWLGD